MTTIRHFTNPCIDHEVRHNFPGEDSVVAQVAIAVAEARRMVTSLTGSVSLTISDDDGTVADVVLYSGDHTAHVRDCRTGSYFKVATFEDDELGEPYVWVLSNDE
jgi:hypothetical protein